MKDFQTIIEFRKSYKKLHYLQGHLTIVDLTRWVDTWCQERNFDFFLQFHFRELALSYVEKELHENSILNKLKAQRLQKHT